MRLNDQLRLRRNDDRLLKIRMTTLRDLRTVARRRSSELSKHGAINNTLAAVTRAATAQVAINKPCRKVGKNRDTLTAAALNVPASTLPKGLAATERRPSLSARSARALAATAIAATAPVADASRRDRRLNAMDHSILTFAARKKSASMQKQPPTKNGNDAF